MRIAFIVSAFPRLTESFIRQQAISLIERGHDVEILGDLERGDNYDAVTAASWGLSDMWPWASWAATFTR